MNSVNGRASDLAVTELVEAGVDLHVAGVEMYDAEIQYHFRRINELQQKKSLHAHKMQRINHQIDSASRRRYKVSA